MIKKTLVSILMFALAALGSLTAGAYVIHQDYKFVADESSGEYEEESWLSGQSITMTEGGSTTISFSSVTAGMKVEEWRLYKNYGYGGYQSYETLGTGTSITLTYNEKYEQSGTTWYLIPCFSYVSYTLTYDPNGGEWTSGEPSDGGGTEHKYSDTLTAPTADRVSKDNAQLVGWKSKSGTLIKVGASFSGSKLGITKEGQAVTLYAQWGAATYDVLLAVPKDAEAKVAKLSKDSSSDDDDDWDYYKTTYTYGKGLTLPLATTSKAGTSFEGWYDNPNYVHDPESKVYSKVTAISKTDEGDKTYYGKFGTKMAIHYDGNGSSKGTMSDQEFVAGSSFSLTRNAFEKVYTVKFKLNGGKGTTPANQTADYTFSHWNSAKDGSGADSYEDGQTVTLDAAVTLYAQWEEEQDAITLPEVDTWSGHTFSGWWTQQSGGTCAGYAGSKYAPQGNITLYAHWDGQGDLSAAVGLENAELTTWCEKKSTYKGEDVVWEVVTEGGQGDNGSCLTVDSQPEAKATSVLAMNVTGPGTVSFAVSSYAAQDLVFYDGEKDETIPLPSAATTEWSQFERSVASGAVQVRWSVGSDKQRVWIDNIRWMPSTPEGECTITAEPSSDAGGSVTGGGTYGLGTNVTLTAKVKTGWKFIEWRKGSENGSSVSKDNPYKFKATNDSAGTYVAVLADEWYYIAFNKNSGTGTMAKQLAVCGQNTTLTPNAFTRTGYVFKGWTTVKNGDVKYADGATVNIDATSGSTVTLYAQWVKEGEEEEEEKEEEGEEEEVTPTPGPYASTVGTTVEVDLAADCGTKTIKSVKGLPTGLKYATKTGLVTGKPTKAVSKTDNVTITFSDKSTVKCTWTVEALPTMMAGTYYGVALVDGHEGVFQLKMLATGKATGSFYAAGKKVSLTTQALAAQGDGYALTVKYTCNKVKYVDTLLLHPAATVDGVEVWGVSLAEASEVIEGVEARRDTIKESFGKVVAKTATYAIDDASLADGEYLKVKVTTAGAVTVSGKLYNHAATPKLTSVSCSTHLVVGDDGAPYADIAIYKNVSKQDPITYYARWSLPE